VFIPSSQQVASHYYWHFFYIISTRKYSSTMRGEEKGREGKGWILI